VRGERIRNLKSEIRRGLNVSRDGDRKSRSSFDQGKPADRSGVRDRIDGGQVNSVHWGRLARGVNDRGFAPETPVKGGITLDEPGFAILRIATD
jgi:hypothetical protein